MKLRRLAELTALIALHRDHIIDGTALDSDVSLLEYLQRSRQRNQLWRQQLDSFCLRPDGSGIPAAGLQHFVAEVFVSEMLTRVWTAILVARDLRRSQSHSAPIARHVLVSVLEMRAKLLEYLLKSVAPLGVLLQADRLRRKCERWIDLLIGELGRRDDVLEFAVDPRRAAEFRDQTPFQAQTSQPATWALLSSGIRQAVPDYVLVEPSASLQQAIARAMTATLPGLDGLGELRGYPPRDNTDSRASLLPHVDTPPGEWPRFNAARQPDEASRQARRTRLSFQELLRRSAQYRDGGDASHSRD